jgi:hypothetical protein
MKMITIETWICNKKPMEPGKKNRCADALRLGVISRFVHRGACCACAILLLAFCAILREKLEDFYEPV